jgi:hypothetical protein
MGRRGRIMRIMRTRFGPSVAVASLAVVAFITLIGFSGVLSPAPAPATPGSATDQPGPTTTVTSSTAALAGTTTTSSTPTH